MEEITEEEVKKLMKIPGKARGVVFQTDAEYVRSKKGEEGLLAVQRELKKMGCPIDYENIKATSWHPLGLRAISLLVIKAIFNWSDKEIEDMGNMAPKYSFIVKMFLKYFFTISKSYKESPKYWVKHYTVGKLETPGYNLKKKYFYVRLKDFQIHPVLCVYLGGYFMRIAQYLVKGENFKSKETRCQFSGDPYHEFLVVWE